ncbi:MAG TPA: acetyl-CoA carboxylase biotin carboxyl carrier protein [Desulfobacteria bacterium]|nr:acetyl-CoA carboxylase biotin carboxyl carrier protein [Desulfobacteria bacterium]
MVKVTDTTLRDGHQSLWATRMKTTDMIPILTELDNVGYHSLEVWGGATFDVCMRYLDEDPWERLKTIKRYVAKTPLQMLLRGQSLLGYKHYPDDVVRAFVHKMVENGIDIVRIFDALNDVRNIEVPLKAVKETGAHAQASVVYTISPVHTTAYYLKTALSLQDMGADSICIKDMAGMLTPFKAKEIVTAFKQNLKIPVQLHSHYVGGMAVGAYLMAAEAGVDVIDTASVPLAFGSSQPPVETVVRALQDSQYSTGLDIARLFKIARYFEDVRLERGFERGVTRISDMQVFDHQVPGGMISNFISQLEQQKALHRLNEVLAEIPRVREELGYPPLVTPTSQIVGAQAVSNILTGVRYKLIPREVKAYAKGYYGKSPAEINPEVKRKILGDEEPITCRPADLLEPMLEKRKAEIGSLARNAEDVLSYALFPEVARKFFETRLRGADNPVSKAATAAKEDSKMNLQEIKELIKMLDETEISELNLESEGVRINIKKGGVVSAAPAAALPVTAAVAPAAAAVSAAETKAAEASVDETNPNLVPIVAPMVGTFYSSPAPDAPAYVEVGSTIKAGEAVCIVEAMKLMNEIEAEVAGKIVEILVENGQAVEYGQTLFLVEKQ